MQLSVKLERQLLLRVIVRRQIALFFRTVRRNALARIVNPAHDVIEVRLFTDAGKVCSEVATDLVVAFTDLVTGKTSTTLEKFFTVSGVALRLCRELVVEALLPQIRSDRLNLVGAVFVAHVRAGGAFR